MGENEQGFMTGAVAGMGSGAAMGAAVGSIVPGVGTAVGALAGAAIGFAAGGLIGYEQADSQRLARKEAEKQAEKARRSAIIKEMGAKEQASMMAFSAAMRGGNNRSGGSSKAPGIVSNGQGEGTIGSNISSSNNGSAGTF